MKVGQSLLDKYASGQCTPAEKAVVEAWLANTDDQIQEMHVQEFSASKSRIWAGISKDLPVKKSKEVFISQPVIRYAAAACITALLGIGSFFISTNQQQKNITDTSLICQGYEHTVPNPSFEAKMVKVKGGSEFIGIYLKAREEEFAVYYPGRLPERMAPAMRNAICSMF